MACGNKLISPKLHAGQELSAELIHKIYKSKALYIRPSKTIEVWFYEISIELFFYKIRIIISLCGCE